VKHLHQLLMELIAAGAQRNLTAKKAKALLAKVRPRDIAGRTRRALAVDLVEELVGLDRRLSDLDKRLKTAVTATGTTLTDITGVGTATAAMILGEVGDVRYDSRGCSYYAKKVTAGKGRGCSALPQAPPLRRRVPPPRRGPATAGSGVPGCALRGRHFNPARPVQRRHFGAATHRAPRRPCAQPCCRVLTQRGAATERTETRVAGVRAGWKVPTAT